MLLDHLTPAMLTTLAYLAGFLDQEHSLHTILQTVQDAAKRVIPFVSVEIEGVFNQITTVY